MRGASPTRRKLVSGWRTSAIAAPATITLGPLETHPVPLRVGIERGGERFVEDGSKIDLVVDDGLWPVERAVACRVVDGLRAVFNQMQRPEFDLDGDLERARHGFERDDASLCHGRRQRPVYG